MHARILAPYPVRSVIRFLPYVIVKDSTYQFAPAHPYAFALPFGLHVHDIYYLQTILRSSE